MASGDKRAGDRERTSAWAAMRRQLRSLHVVRLVTDSRHGKPDLSLRVIAGGLGLRVAVAAIVVFAALFLRFAWGHLGALQPRWLQVPIWLAACLVTVLVCAEFFLLLWYGKPVASAPAVIDRSWFDPFTRSVFVTFTCWVLLTAAFAFGTYLFDRERVTAAARTTDDVPPRQIPWHAYYKAVDEYEWSTLDVLPFVDATSTLDWKEPATIWPKPPAPQTRLQRQARVAQTAAIGPAERRYSKATGALLLVYKALVLAPVLAAVAFAWKAIRDRAVKGSRDSSRVITRFLHL
jgi:hypothetical protein